MNLNANQYNLRYSNMPPLSRNRKSGQVPQWFAMCTNGIWTRMRSNNRILRQHLKYVSRLKVSAHYTTVPPAFSWIIAKSQLLSHNVVKCANRHKSSTLYPPWETEDPHLLTAGCQSSLPPLYFAWSHPGFSVSGSLPTASLPKPHSHLNAESKAKEAGRTLQEEWVGHKRTDQLISRVLSSHCLS